jgi:hypothetical protein
MAAWPKDALRRIAETDDPHVARFREDGTTYGTPTWIWSVVVDDAPYVRNYHRTRSRWYGAAMRQRAGRISAAGTTEDVTVEGVTGPLNDRIDEAYRKKYRGSPYPAAMIGPRARAATVRITPRQVDTP